MAGTTTYYGISYPTSTDYVKDGATAMQTIADGFDSAVAIPTYNNQTGTSYTFVLADAGKTVTSNNASAVTFTIPPQSSVAWANNTTLTVRNLGAGVVTIAGGAGVTVTNTAQTVGQYASVRIIRTASNAWTVVPAGGGGGLTLVSESNPSASSGVTFTGLTVGKRYLIMSSLTASANGNQFALRFRENTTDKATGYNGAGTSTNYSSGTISNYTLNNNSRIWLTYSGDSIPFTLVMDIFVHSASKGTFTFQLLNSYNGNAIQAAGWNESMTNFNGVSIYPESGTFTGKISLYEYQ